MTFRYSRSYRGPLQAAIFDWAGTTVDFGSLAPAAVFLKIFEEAGVPVTLDEARGPMGIHKRVHIEIMLAMDSVAQRWQAKHGKRPGEAEVDRLFAAFVPAQLACLAEHSALIPGTLETMRFLRGRGMKIGSTSGYTREMMEINLVEAARQGYEPDCMACVSDVPVGRPGPAMALVNVAQLSIGAVAACVKVDDTVAGVEEGLNAGMWSVGLAVSGNEVGLSLADWQALPAAEQARRRQAAERRLAQAGAHYVIDSVAELPAVVEDIEARLARGERP